MIAVAPAVPLVKALSRVFAVCHTCALQHLIEFDPAVGPGNAVHNWYVKHPDPHLVEFRAPRRNQRADEPQLKKAGWLHYLHNADSKVAYGATAAYTITLASLAASSTYLAGRESTSISNTSNKYLDFMISGRFKAASTNTQVGNIQIGVVSSLDDTPNWPDVFDGTDSVETVTSAGIYNSLIGDFFAITAESSASRVYETPQISLCGLKALLFPPTHHVIFVSHAIETSTNGWDSTEGSHFLKYTPVYATVI